MVHYGVVMGHAVADCRLASGGYGLTKGTNIANNISLDWNILKSLKWYQQSKLSDWTNSKNRLFGTEL